VAANETGAPGDEKSGQDLLRLAIVANREIILRSPGMMPSTGN
jgi:hypothetical protein